MTDETLIDARDEAREVARSLLVIAERALALAVTIQHSRAEAEETTRNIHGLREARRKIEAWDEWRVKVEAWETEE